MPNSRISMLVTSCQRHDLLRVTLESFYETTDIEPQEVIICEDSNDPMPEWLNTAIWKQRGLRWLSNECRMGQIYSADRLLQEARYEYIFWCEDDWQFTESSGWMNESKRILDTYPSIIQVSLRGNTNWHDLMDADDYPKERFKIAVPYWRGTWGAWSFNCGLRRLSTLRALGSFGRHVSYGTSGLGHEAELSKKLLDEGYRIADLNRPIVVHTGGSRSRAIEPLPPQPRILIAIPACHKFDYGRWESEQSPHYNQATAWENRPYGTDIHISGANPRIDAVRETWARDIVPFAAHVDLRFFYGEPHPRPALADEIYVPCGDDYASLPRKTVEICKWATENNYDWLLKADDDTYIWVDRLVHELMSNRFDYAGYTHSNVCTGGPSYWLSKRAMREVVRNGIQDHWAEDVTVGKIMTHVNIQAVHLEGHRPGFAAHWFDINNIPERTVAIHAVKPEDMRELYKREHTK